jgi:immunity protein 8 of polymorphic toxin system
MRPAIKSISTIDGDDPARYQPSDGGTFAVTLRLLIGPADSVGEESFDVTVCSPAWLEKECERNGFVLGRHHLVVRGYDFRFIERVLAELIGRYSGETWPEIAEKISRLAYWEFEDYQPADSTQ